MKKLNYFLPLLLLAASTTISCSESEVDNPTNPDTEEQTPTNPDPDIDDDKDDDPVVSTGPEGNLILDYGFDLELGAEDGWKASVQPQNISIVDDSDEKNSFDSNALRITMDAQTRPQAIGNTFEVTKGTTYTISFSGVFYPNDNEFNQDSAGSFISLNIVEGTAGKNTAVAAGNQRIYAADIEAAGEGAVIDRQFTIDVPEDATYTTMTPRFVLTAGTVYLDKISVVEGDVMPLTISSFKIEPVEIEDDVHYQKLVVDHNGDEATAVVKYEIVEGDGEIKLYSIAGSDEFYYYAPTPSTVSTLIKVIITDGEESIDETCTYQSAIFTYDNYYLDKTLWEEVNNPTNAAAYAFHENNPALPNILLIGTSISVGYTNPVWSGMSGLANVYRIPENSLNTPYGLQKLDFWLNGIGGADVKWDVIHFNFGHHDLKQSNSGYAVPLADYKTNLPLIFDKLLAHSKKLVWANTTYCNQCGNKGSGTFRVPADIVKYNAAAAEILSQDKYSSILVDDQYTLTESNKQWLNGVHFTGEGYSALAKQVCGWLKYALGVGEKPGTSEPTNPDITDPADPIELISDSSFDKALGTDGWKAVQVVGDISIVDESNSQNLFGNNALRLTLSSAAKNTQVVAKAISITPGASYKVTYSAVYYPDDNAFVNGKGGKFLTLNFAQGAQTGLAGGNITTTSNGSQRIYDTDDDFEIAIIDREFVLTIPSEATYTAITPKFVLTAGTAYIDNVSVMKLE